MKKTVLCLLGACTLLTAGLTSCGDNSDVKLTNQESRNLRIASAIGVPENVRRNAKGAELPTDVSENIQAILPSLDIVVENNFKVDSEVIESEEGKEVVFNGATYEFKETITYLDGAQNKNEVVIYYNDILDTKDNKYSEFIEGAIVVNGTEHAKFESTAYTEVVEGKAHDKRDLSLYLGPTKATSLVISEETKLVDKELSHRFTYALVVASHPIMSYSIELDRAHTTMSLEVLTFKFNLTRERTENTITYKAAMIASDTELISLVFEGKVENNQVSYSLKLNAGN